jgi:CRP-like cAMP-binding protein
MPVLARRLDALAKLSTEDLKVLAGLRGRTVDAGTIVSGQAPDTPHAGLILSGWCARTPGSESEQHPQITGVMLPGDAFGLGGSPWAGDQLAVMTLTPCVIVNAAPLRQLIRLRSPMHASLIEACNLLAWQEQTYALNQIFRLGGRDGYKRVAHLIVELFLRMKAVGMTRNGLFEMPLSQRTLATILGLSKVHFNRVTRRLSCEGLALFPRGAVNVPNLQSLASVAGFRICNEP